MYNALIQSDLPIDKNSNNRLWKLKLPLRIKVFGWYLRKGVILTKDNLAKRNWNESRTCVFCHQDETIKHLFFQCRFARSIWSVIQLASTLFPPRSIANIFENWLNGIDNRFKKHIRVERLPLFGRYGYVEMIKCLTTKLLPFCRLYTGVSVLYVYGPLFSEWRIETSLWRFVHVWRLRWGILFPNMDGRIAFILLRHDYICSWWYVILPFSFVRSGFWLCAS
jgi:hypothetical protein